MRREKNKQRWDGIGWLVWTDGVERRKSARRGKMMQAATTAMYGDAALRYLSCTASKGRHRQMDGQD